MIKANLSTYNRIINQLIIEAKTTYYNNEFSKYNNDIKNTWKVINSILNRDKNKSNFPSKILHDNSTLSNMNEIVNCLNNYFSTAGETLAESIPTSKNHFNFYLRERINHVFHFNLTTPEDIQKLSKTLNLKQAVAMTKSI